VEPDLSNESDVTRVESDMDTQIDTTSFEVRSDVEAEAAATIDVINLAAECGITSWICYGALLGMVREGRLLPWNNDVQLACWHHPDIIQRFIQLTDKLNTNGYHAYYYSSIGAISVRNSSAIVNLTCFWKENDMAVRPHETAAGDKLGVPFIGRLFWWLGTFSVAYSGAIPWLTRRPLSKTDAIKSLIICMFRILPMFIRKKLMQLFYRISKIFGTKSQKTGIPVHLFSELKPMDFYGGKVPAPKSSEVLLEYLYGKDWRIPADDWSFYAEENKDETGMKFIDEPWKWERHQIV